MPGLLVNVDVPDLEAGLAFYTAALGLTVGRRLGAGIVELLGSDAPIYLLEKVEGTPIGPRGQDRRRYSRHWSPLHLDFVVTDLESAVSRATAAGAVREGELIEGAFGRLAMFADPFDHGFCLIEFSSEGYDAIAT